MKVLKEIDAWIRGWLSPDRKPHDDWTIPRSPAEMRTWRELPDPKPTYQEYVGIPEEDLPSKSAKEAAEAMTKLADKPLTKEESDAAAEATVGLLKKAKK